MNRDPEPPASSSDGPPAAQAGKGFKARKREDHALMLIEELRGTLGDLSRVKRILVELGRYYGPVLGEAIMDIPHQRQIVAALEAGWTEAAQAMIEARYASYIKDRPIWAGGRRIDNAPRRGERAGSRGAVPPQMGLFQQPDAAC